MCTKASLSDVPYTRYKLRNVNTAIQELANETQNNLDCQDANTTPTTKLTPLQLYKLCFNEKFAVEGSYPGIKRGANRLINLSLYGNTQGKYI